MRARGFLAGFELSMLVPTAFVIGGEAVDVSGPRWCSASPLPYSASLALALETGVVRGLRVDGDEVPGSRKEPAPTPGPVWLLNILEGISKQAFKTWLAAQPQARRDG